MQVGHQAVSQPAPGCLCLQEEPGPLGIQPGCGLEGRQSLETPELSAWKGCPSTPAQAPMANESTQEGSPLPLSAPHLS